MKVTNLFFLLFGCAYLACGQMAAAQTDDGKRGEVFCFPTKSVPKIVNRINAVGVDRRDVVDVRLDPKFLIKDGGVWPDAFYLAKDGQPIMDMPFSREDGRVANFLEAVALEPNSDICVVDPTRADKSEDDEGLYFEMGLSPVFLKATGEHNIEDIKKGSRDAKSFYKKMIPAPLRLLMPDTNYLAVKYKDPKFLVDNARPEIFARVDGSDIELDYERHKDMFIVSGKNLRKMGASMLVVSGGEYDLQPVPSLSMIRRFEKQSKDDSKSVEVGIDATESVDDEHTPFEQ